MNRAGREDGEAALVGLDGTVTFDFEADGAVALEEDSANEGVGLDGEVGAGAGWREVADGCRDPKATDFVHGVGSGSPAGWGVGIVAAGVAEFVGGFEPCPMDGRELVPLVAADGDGSGVAVVGAIAEVEVSFESAKGGEYVVPRPLGVAGGGPGVVILGEAAQGDGGVDGTGAAGDPASGEGCGASGGGGLVGEAPIVGGVGVVMAIEEVEGEVCEVGIIGPGLEEEDGTAWVFACPGGDGGA